MGFISVRKFHLLEQFSDIPNKAQVMKILRVHLTSIYMPVVIKTSKVKRNLDQIVNSRGHI